MSDAKKPAADQAAPAAATKKAGGGSKMVPILVGVNSLVMLGVLGLLAMQMMQNKSHDSKPAAKEEKAEAKEGEKKEGEEHAEKKQVEEKKEEHGEKKEGEEKKEGGEGAAASKSSSGNGAMGPLVKISDFVVHLRNPEVDRYARISFDVEVIADTDKDALNKSMSKVRDAFISYLSDRTVEELRGSDGLGRTKDALQTKLRDLVPDTRIRALYISDFVIQ